MSEEEWEAHRRRNDPARKHGQGAKGGNEANPGGNRKNEAPPKGGQTGEDDKYEP